ncbi:hypothetical protein B0H66DRAFT_306852 [Apodospora peruviana]|uniref:Uncharacterized protein n=1 Tax=Apodospora peruviana TaxID=516989 RepID=A0AAE0I1M0_9PEZI|nr:hypothetical protein B0H66DRAFT_306852 [Apodospora peruviana]
MHPLILHHPMLSLLLLLLLTPTSIWSRPTTGDLTTRSPTIPWPQFRKSVRTPTPTTDHDYDHHHCQRHDHDPNCGCGCDDHNPPPPPPPVDFQKRNFDTISNIYNLTVYPHQVPIILGGAAGVPPGLFSQSVVGRVDPVGDFRGFEDSIEYFFALAPLPQGNPLNAAITSYKITEFSSACSDVAASVVHLFCSVVNPGCPDDGTPLPPLKQVAFWKFDAKGDVLKYDAWIPNLNDWVVKTTGAPVFIPEGQLQSIQQICAVTQMRCHGPNQQWDSIDQCVETLAKKSYGNYDSAWGDNVVCRSIHLVLTQVRPDHHCPHVGPTGGGKCIEHDYGNDYFNDTSLYGDALGETFMCKK